MSCTHVVARFSDVDRGPRRVVRLPVIAVLLTAIAPCLPAPLGGEAKAQTVAEVVAALKAVEGATTRSVVVEVVNQTDRTFTLAYTNHENGGFVISPPAKLLPHSSVAFGSKSTGSSNGTEGTVRYQSQEMLLTVHWDNPTGGSNACNVGLATGPNPTQFRASSSCGSGNKDALMHYEVYLSSWWHIPGCAKDISASGQNVWIVGCADQAPGGWSIHHWTGLMWEKVGGRGARIAVAADGTPWLVNLEGSIYRRVGAAWEKQPGCAYDVGAGTNGAIWVIGCTKDPGPGGYSIHYWNGQKWQKVDGAGTRIVVGPDGTPWLVNAEGSIYRRTGSAWTKLPGCARDITVDAAGAAWIVGCTEVNGGWNLFHWVGNGWLMVEGAGDQISAGAGSRIWVANKFRDIYYRDFITRMAR